MANINNKFNGVNTEVLNSALNSIKNQPEMAKAMFSVKSEWNGGFSVTSSIKDFHMGSQTIHRNTEHILSGFILRGMYMYFLMQHYLCPIPEQRGCTRPCGLLVVTVSER